MFSYGDMWSAPLKVCLFFKKISEIVIFVSLSRRVKFHSSKSRYILVCVGGRLRAKYIEASESLSTCTLSKCKYL